MVLLYSVVHTPVCQYKKLTRTGNVFMSDRSSLAASDGNNKPGQGFIESESDGLLDC